MIAELPTSLLVGGVEREIRSDYRAALDIFAAFNDMELNDAEKNLVMLKILFVDDIESEYTNEAINQAVWFLNLGDTIKSNSDMRLYDWEQDRTMIFSAVNKVCGKEVRSVEYMHFWTFVSFFMEIGEGLFSNVISIREKQKKGKKLEDYEREFYLANKELIDLKRKYDTERQTEINNIMEQIK